MREITPIGGNFFDEKYPIGGIFFARRAYFGREKYPIGGIFSHTKQVPACVGRVRTAPNPSDLERIKTLLQCAVRTQNP